MNAQDKAASAIRRCNRIVFGTEIPSLEQVAEAEARMSASLWASEAEEEAQERSHITERVRQRLAALDRSTSDVDLARVIWGGPDDWAKVGS